MSRPVMDFPAAWEYVRTTDPTDHHDQCSWRSTGGALLCDCTVLNDEYKRREARTKALDEVRAAVGNINDRDLDTLTIALVLATIDKLKEVPTDER